MFTIMKAFHFEAAHRLDGLPPGHPCGRLHGHSYKVEVFLRAATLDGRGFVEDFGDMRAAFGNPMLTQLDHQFLNDVICAPYSPTAERLAAALYARAQVVWPRRIHAIRVWETADAYAEYREE